MITVSDVSKAYGGKKLFIDVDTSFSPGRRYGLTGPNGAGKSTFMKVLAGDLDPDNGRVSRPRKTSVLRQDQYAYENDRAIDVVIRGDRVLWEALQEKEKLLASPEITDAIGHRLGDLETTIGEEDGYMAESNAGALLEGLGIASAFHERPMRELTGGLKVRVLLAQALFGQPQALLLDEPTNNLDLDTIRWLESFLESYEGTLIVISHDRHFLNAVCTHIADIDYETIIVYTGNYDDMVLAKSEVRSRIEKENSDKQKRISQLQDFVARFHAGTRASQVQSRIKQIEKLEINDLKRSNIARPFIQFMQKRPSGKQTLTLEGLSKSYGKRDIIVKFDALVTRGEKIAVLGKNGIGKSTLVKSIVGALKPEAGEVTWGHEASVGYLPQDHENEIPRGTTCFDWLRGLDEKASNEEIRGLLGKMLFQGDDGMKSTDVLSGGERVRLLFSKLMLMKDNVLVLDEPTGHLDLESISALTFAMQKYEGTVLIVTHDRDLVSRATSRLWVLSEEDGTPTVLDFSGSYDDFLAKHGATHQ